MLNITLILADGRQVKTEEEKLGLDGETPADRLRNLVGAGVLVTREPDDVRRYFVFKGASGYGEVKIVSFRDVVFVEVECASVDPEVLR